MKAFRFEDSPTGIRLQNVPIPDPSAGQVLIAVEAAGICHSDVYIIKGHGKSWAQPRPITLGHEVAGTIAKLGPGPSPFRIGDRVAIALISHPVGAGSWEETVGLGYDGGYAEYALAFQKHLVRIPDGVSFAQAAVATDSIATAYHAVVTEAKVTASSTIAIIGLGGLGLNGVTFAALQGAKVYGIDVNEDKFEDAKYFGAIDCAKTLDKFSDIVFDAIVDFAGVGSTTASAISAVKEGGCVVLVGLGAASIHLDPTQLVTRMVTLQGSLGASLDELRTVLDLIASGSITPKLQEIPFEQLPHGLQLLEKNEAQGRLFLSPDKGPRL
ncbi:hypothetical protein SLS56_007156 [Neofusicoccum ribis]|uniref:Enoyl reductase (ER) domain-containing protein n=1 Tax=Neofusicoccum ribis TaxID=45134 RepID=A0ABR3SPN0_9PEZI